MRNKNAGVSLASIVSKETTETAWSGSGVGIGLTAAGISPMLGFANGSSHSQTRRAQDFAEPKKEEANIAKIFEMPIKIFGMACVFYYIPYVMNFGMGLPDPNDKLLNTFKTSLNTAGLVLFLISVGLSAYIGLSGKTEIGENERRKAYKLKERIYNRLRYIENDHVIFDPVSNLETPANKAGLETLLQQNH